jgi:pimeloyl-ACP methyl ester carboxylesterase
MTTSPDTEHFESAASDVEPLSRPVYDRRPGTGPTLVLLHYWGGSSRTWDPVIQRLPGRDALTIDARGWSRSCELPGPFTLEQQAADVGAVLAEAGVSDYVLVGHSMGGKVAQLVAAERPAGLRGLVLVAPAPARPAPTITPEYQMQLAHAYDDAASRAFARDEVLTATALPDPLKAQVERDSAAAAGPARLEWPLHGIAEDVSARAQAIAVPALVVAGEHDRVEPPALLRENLLPYLASAEFAVVPGSGHLLPLEAPDDLSAHIERFVAGL